MAKKSGRAKGKQQQKARKGAGSFKVGDSVRVLSGDYGNAHGQVVKVDGGTCAVQLANNRGEPVEVDVANLVHGGPKDRVT